MGLLDEFLCALTPNEREQVARMPLKGKEDLVLRSLMPQGTDCVARPPNFDISIDHLNKIQSVLLRKCYSNISGGDDVRLIWFLNQRNLNKHMHREIQRVEQELAAKHLLPEQLLPYYKEFFLSSVDVLARYFDPERARRYQEQYLALVPVETRETERCNCEAKYAYPHLVKAGMTVMTAEQKDQMGRYLLQLLENAQRLNHLEAMVLCLKNLVYYHNYTRPNIALRYRYLSQMESLVEGAPDGYFPNLRKAITRADMAEFLLSTNQWEQALEKYRAVFSQFPEQMANKPYHCARYTQTAVLCEAFAEASQVLDLHFKRHLAHYHASLSPMAATMFVMYYLHLPDLAQCRKHLDMLWEANNKQDYLVYEVYYRALETVWLWASNEHETANTAAARHIKYLRSRKIKQNYDPICLVFPYVQALYLHKTTRKELGKKHLGMKAQLNSGYFALFGKILG